MTTPSSTRRRVEELRTRVGEHLEGAGRGRGVRVALVCSRFNGAITTRLLEGALDVLHEAGVDRSDITVGWVPGAFEIPLMALAFADGDRPVDAVITLGAVIRGETTHYEIVVGRVRAWRARRAAEHPRARRLRRPHRRTLDQALERSANDEANKGREAATTALEMVSVLRQGSWVSGVATLDRDLRRAPRRRALPADNGERLYFHCVDIADGTRTIAVGRTGDGRADRRTPRSRRGRGDYEATRALSQRL